MILYGLYILAFLFLHLSIKNGGIIGERDIKQQCSFCFLLLFVFYGFRDLHILNDTAHYYDHFRYLISDGSFDKQKIWEYNHYDRFGVGFLIYENIVGHLWRNPYAIIMFSAFIITISWIYLVKHETKNIALCFFLILVFGIIGSHYSGLRQGLAVCIFFFSYQEFLKKDKLKLYLLGCILSVLFHTSAIVLFLIPILRKFRINKKTCIISIIVAISISLGLNFIFEITGLNETSRYFGEALERTTLPIANFVALFFFSSMMLLSKGAQVNKTKETEMLWWFSILNLVFRFLACFIGIIGRYTMYFAVFTIILFANSIREDKKLDAKKVLLILMAFIYVFITLTYKPEWSHLIPYSFYDFSVGYHNTDFGY